MATKIGPTAAAVEQKLLANGEKFSYFQAVRLLRLFAKARGSSIDSLRIRPKLGLGFPENDIDAIEPIDSGGYRITANFFGLYGVSSPLPTYYTEDLFDEEREGRHATRDFLDVIHYAIYPLLFEAWRKPRLQDRVVEDRDKDVLNQLFAFVGLNDARLRSELPESDTLLRYAGLFNQFPRSAMGLATLLADALSPAKVTVKSCTLQQVKIADDQLVRLGQQACTLGEDTHLGTHIDDYCGSISIRLTDLSEELFHELLPGTTGHERLTFLTRFYLIDPLEVKVELQLRRSEARCARTPAQFVIDLNSDLDDLSVAPDFNVHWSRLGLDTWLAPEQSTLPTEVEFML
jgi:type VI secretion system protein ImpH